MNTSAGAVNLSQNFGRLTVTDRFAEQQQRATGVTADDVRDRIINSYRDEIKSHQARERDYQLLQQVMVDLQRRIRGLETEIATSQRDHEDRIRDQTKVATNLQGDLESIKKNIHDRGDEGIHIYE